eukprot:1593613-Prymnesium_polylepis.1
MATLRQVRVLYVCATGWRWAALGGDGWRWVAMGGAGWRRVASGCAALRAAALARAGARWCAFDRTGVRTVRAIAIPAIVAIRGDSMRTYGIRGAPCPILAYNTTTSD